ncbi:MAG TPA: UDP-glucuronosyltransferase, partial [Candidatus Omnitrophota bacterium]|nr:UDP-glucuronosyltransferase [Candidatus Omnitrophota bacterium]
MAGILIAWELGEALGHLARCLRLAAALRHRGHGVVLVLKDIRLPGWRMDAKDVVVLQAPHSPRRQPTDGRMPVNYADV